MCCSYRAALIQINLATFAAIYIFATAHISSIARAQINLISSWESASELTEPFGGGWNMDLLNVPGSVTHSIESTIGVTEGSSSFEVAHTGQLNGSGNTHFDRAAELDLTDSGGPLSLLFEEVADNLTLYQLEFDVTLDPGHIADFPADSGAFSPFIGLSLWHSDSSGCCNDSNTGNVKVWGEDEINDIIAGGVPVTTHLTIPATRIDLAPAVTRYGFATNGNWVQGQTTSFFFDNMFWREVRAEDAADLNRDGFVDDVDWGLFLAHHSRDFSNDDPMPDPEQAFMMGDLDADLDNDFDDFLIFETTYDIVNGPGSFQELLASVPEPSTLALAALMAGTLACRRRSGLRGALVALLLTVVTIAGAQDARAQSTLLHSWENGLEGWAPVGFASAGRNPAIAVSNIGVTDGAQSLGFTHDEDGFSWSFNQSYTSGSVYEALQNAANLGPDNFALEFDVTYDTSFIPQDNPPLFMAISLAHNDANGWSQVAFPPIADSQSDGQTNETKNVSVPLSDLDVAAGDFHELIFGLEGDWGISPATVFIDNLRLTQTSVPAQLTLEVDMGSGATTLLNESGQNVNFDYYTIDSPSGSLSPTGWNSLDDQGVDAVDGADDGTIAGDSLLEGWDAGAGFPENLTEAFLLGSSTWSDETSMSIGTGFDTSVGTQDLTLQFRDPAAPDRLRAGIVRYIETTPTADLNMDGFVDGLDLGILLGNFNQTAPPEGGELNGTPPVDGLDLGILLGEWNPAPPSGVSAVPEPSTCLMIAVSMLTAACGRVRAS